MARTKEKADKFLVLKNGTEYRLLRTEGAFYVCEGTRFRLTNPEIAEIRTAGKKGSKETAQ